MIYISTGGYKDLNFEDSIKEIIESWNHSF